MALYPGAAFKPTTWGGKVARNRQGRGILHVSVSARVSYPPYSANTWHFYVAAAAPNGSSDGSGGPAYCEQYVDTDYRAYGDVDANDDALVVETAGGLGTSAQLNAERWTRAQELRIADLMLWESQQPGGAPLELLPDSMAGRRGWGPHRLGIKNSAGLVAGWWQPGGEVWSTSLGKECPGNSKIAQIPGIISLAHAGAQTEDDVKLDDTIAWRRPDTGVVVTTTVADWLAYANYYAGKAATAAEANTKAIEALSAKVDALPKGGSGLPTEFDVPSFVRALTTEMNRQARDGDPATGPTT